MRETIVRAESKVQVKVLDVSGLEQIAHDAMQKKGDREFDSMSVTRQFGYVETPKGIYLLCQEGVGDKYPVSEKNPAEFEFVREFMSDGSKSMEMFPCIGYRLSAEEVKQLPVKEVVTLDKFIRTFGSRLECNYREWQEYLSEKMEKSVNA